MNQKSMKKLKIAAIALGVVFLISVIVGLIVVNNNHSSGVSKTAKKRSRRFLPKKMLRTRRRLFPNMAIQFDTTRAFLLAKVMS